MMPGLTAASPSTAGATADIPLPKGHPLQVGDGRSESLTSITARDRVAGPQAPVGTAPARLQPNRAQLGANPGSANLSATPEPQPPVALGPHSPQATGTQFLGAQASDSCCIPPDTMGVAGPSQFVVIVNGRIRSFNKATGVADGVLDTTTDSFFNSVRNGVSTSDPRVRYDRFSGRWFFTMLNLPSGSPISNRQLIGFSDSGTLSNISVITFRFLDFGGAYPGCGMDYDTLGIDPNALYIGANLFCGPNVNSLSFQQSDGIVFSKSALLSGAPTAFDFRLFNTVGAPCTSAATDGAFAPQGVDNADPAASFGFFAGVSACLFGELALVRITNPGGGSPSAAATLLSVPATRTGAAVPAQGSNHPLDKLDDRLMNAQLRNGHLWAAHHICVDTTGTAPNVPCPAGDRDGIRWYDLTSLGSSPTLNQSGTVFDSAVSNPSFYWMPSINASGQNHVAMGSSVAGNNEHAEAATMGRLATDSSGTMQAATVFQASTFAYNLQSNPTSGFQRWGDYSYTSVDPSDDMTMWTIQEYTNATDSWGVEVAQLKAPPPATPSATDGTPLFTNQCSQIIQVTGTSTSGSGFFDPGPGFPNHLQASASGGVVVNHVTYVDPTHITLDISTQGAAAGPKNLTVTNPDGQMVTGIGVLTVGGASAQPDAQTATSRSQYTLPNSDGSTWQEIDSALQVGCTPAVNQSTLLSANSDLWTANAGFNQDIGIFFSDNGGGDTLIAWKESGGFAGTFSPNAAYVQTLFAMQATHVYVFKLKWKTNKPASGSTIFAGAGPIGGQFSPTSLAAETFAAGAPPNFAVRTTQYTLSNSNGTTWTPIDAVNLATTLSPGANSTAVLGGNVDLWTSAAGVNQDIAIFVSDNSQPFTLVGWKESGGFAGTFSPNAAFVKATMDMVSGHTYQFQLRWKSNANAPGQTIFAGAGPISAQFSPTSLFAQTIPAGTNPIKAASTSQYSQSNSDGSSWLPIDSGLDVTVSPGSNTNSLLGANIDLWTANAGVNQDIAIFVSVDSTVDQLVAWKESGGFAGTFSPNAAFAQSGYHMLSGHSYVFKLKWKANHNASGATIFAAAGGPAPFSPTRLTVELTN